MGKKKFEIEKDTLNKLLWLLPTTEIAKLIGVSDKAIEKRAKVLGLNKPPRGYWRRSDVKKLTAGEYVTLFPEKAKQLKSDG